MKIAKIFGREVLDSRGNPTVEADVYLEDGTWGQGKVPSGASVGSHEAHELRDGDTKRYGGLGVQKAVANINDVIAHDLVGLDVEDQRMLDTRMIALDGTANKEHLGANAILAVSIALIKAASISHKMPLYKYIGGADAKTLPIPLMNVINGGKHALDSTDFQEFMIVPGGAESFNHAMQMGLEIYYQLKNLIKDKGLSTNVGDEGGFGLNKASSKQALDLLMSAISKTGYQAGKDVWLALDLASDEFYKDGIYNFEKENLQLNNQQMQSYLADLANSYPLYSIEDPLYEDDWSGYQSLTAAMGKRLQIVGDDFFVTNAGRLQKGIDEKCCNAILIKPNQIGTVTETIDTVQLAKQNGFAAVISHRSGETTDTFIADLSVALGTGQIKTGSPARGERTAKYNQLLRIEEDLGAGARFVGIG